MFVASESYDSEWNGKEKFQQSSEVSGEVRCGQVKSMCSVHTYVRMFKV